MFKKLSLYCAVFFAVLFLTSCKEGEKKNVKGKIIIGTSAIYTPFEFIENGKIVGLNVDLTRTALVKAGYEVEFIDMDFAELIPALTASKIDLIASSNMIKNNEMDKIISFSDTYYTSGLKLAVAYDNGVIKTTDDIKGLVTGAESGTTGVEFLKNAGAEVVEYSNSFDLYNALIQGRIVALLSNSAMTDDYIKRHPEKIKNVGDFIEKTDIRFGISKKNKELLEDVNKALKILKESGEYDEVIKKWL
ncbi:MAG: transporter substrate-binding domain-containing protein [Rickettsiales bacterium]|jgi:ABC-type amino acid transport substrate-binding protein|nr:transporter substrate-binding domain-containing protein [Rickettsiales bacterium]